MKTPPKDVPDAKHKRIASEELGNITGRRGAGMTTVGGGESLAHSLSHYGKEPPQMEGFPGAPFGFMSRPRGRR